MAARVLAGNTAWRQTGDAKYPDMDIAVEHTKITQRQFPGPDGSTPHGYDSRTSRVC